jgi:hypothetical protein
MRTSLAVELRDGSGQRMLMVAFTARPTTSTSINSAQGGHVPTTRTSISSSNSSAKGDDIPTTTGTSSTTEDLHSSPSQHSHTVPRATGPTHAHSPDLSVELRSSWCRGCLLGSHRRERPYPRTLSAPAASHAHKSGGVRTGSRVHQQPMSQSSNNHSPEPRQSCGTVFFPSGYIPDTTVKRHGLGGGHVPRGMQGARAT